MNKQDKILNNLATNLSLKLGEAEVKVSVLSVELQEAQEKIQALQKQLEEKTQNEEE